MDGNDMQLSFFAYITNTILDDVIVIFIGVNKIECSSTVRLDPHLHIERLRYVRPNAFFSNQIRTDNYHELSVDNFLLEFFHFIFHKLQCIALRPEIVCSVQISGGKWEVEFKSIAQKQTLTLCPSKWSRCCCSKTPDSIPFRV